MRPAHPLDSRPAKRYAFDAEASTHSPIYLADPPVRRPGLETAVREAWKPMSGRPIQQAMVTEIERRGGRQVLLERIGNGESVTAIAKSFGVSRGLFYRYLCATEADKAELRRIRQELTSHALAEKALELVDLPDAQERSASSAQVQSRKNRAELRLRLAAAFNQDEFGKPNPQGGTVMNIAELHVHAVEEHTPRAEIVDAEVLAIEPADDVPRTIEDLF